MKSIFHFLTLFLFISIAACKKEQSTGSLEVIQKNIVFGPWEHYRVWNQETYISMKTSPGSYFVPLHSMSGNGSRSFLIQDMVPGWYGIIIDIQGGQKHESQFFISAGKTKKIEL